MPTVEGASDEGPVVGLLAHPAELREGDAAAARRRTPPPSAPDVTALLRYVGAEMVQSAARPAIPWALYASDVRPEIWARTEELTEPTTRARSSCHMEGGEHLECPMRHTRRRRARRRAAARRRDHRVSRRRRRRAQRGRRPLPRRGGLPARRRATCASETVSAPPAEALDPDAIWTGSRRLGASPAPGTDLERLDSERKPQPKTRRSQQHDRRPDRRRLGARRAARRSHSSSGPTSTRRPARTRC